ncbi:DUF6298 domain-containing protein [Arcticibacter sp. MXS-1]|uniref:DUF6298 domain-containing protein n=1 Tax=Arcticibacter sp. MXS-1 TaxID=3341726 RepID=UPI0035A94536
MFKGKLHLNKFLLSSLVAIGILASSSAEAQKKKVVKPAVPVATGEDGRLSYTPDSLGNRIPDFSYAGYMGGDKAIPVIPVRVFVPLKKGDATVRIQAALDYVASLPAGKDGIKGAVLLDKGTYEVEGSLKIKSSGVVLRGSGMGEGGTLLYSKGRERETLIRIVGVNDRKEGPAVTITNSYVPVNSFKLGVADGKRFKVGDRIKVYRPCTQKWIETIGTYHFGGGITALGWKPGERDMYWDRTIMAVNGNSLTLDAPLTTALDENFGGGTVSKLEWNGLISQCGVENLRCVSEFNKNNPKDEDHSWMAVTIENAANSWVRRVTFEHFAGSAVAVLESASKVTVEDCKSLAPVSEIGGQRRYTYYTLGQQTLFQRCYAENGYHDFAVGYCATGPNVFVQCESNLPFSFSGTIDSWASGVLFDVVNIDGQALSYLNRGQDAQGAGWSAANSVFWQCSASRIDCYAPPTANNWAFGCWAQFQGNGYWNMSNEHIQPRSLYYAQLTDRLGAEATKRAILLQVQTEASSSPKAEVAAELTALSVKPHPQLSEWIDSAEYRQPLITSSKGIRSIDQIGIKVAPVKENAPAMHIANGWVVRGTAVVTGARHESPWWRGSLQPVELKASKPAVTRYVPGRMGLGMTDDLDEVTDWMTSRHIVSLEHNYGLWYDRRRDDHERIRRMDGEVWPPFFEQPFARSGTGTAWDGLSKYDLTKYNQFYWSRLRHFANLADQKGLVLVHQNYFQHNIIEAGAHYADFPWRTANNINSTGFPEPPPYAGDKRIFMAEQFYDIANPERRALHRAYIRQCLDNFKGNTGVIQLTGAEFTGPLHFVQFWIDVVREWEKENGKNVIIGLSATKDVQDAILADKERAEVVNLIDIRYWHYQADGSAYGPAGGLNLAPRQHARLLKPRRSSFEQVYRAVSEYHQKFPDKAVMYSGDSYDSFGWAAFMAGGSVAQLPAELDPAFLAAASQMKPSVSTEAGMYLLNGGDKGLIIYGTGEGVFKIDLSKYSGSYKLHWISPSSGKLLQKESVVKAGKPVDLAKPVQGDAVLWMSRI